MSSTDTLLLYTAASPNGYKVSILLEELKDAYGLEYTFRNIDIRNNEQKEPWFLKINPNGRIPALVDPLRNNFIVFESAAIILYLAQHYDKERKFSYDPVTESDAYSEQLQWIFFTHGGVGPMQGQAGHFYRFAPEKIPYALDRYINEVKRLYSVLNERLSDRDYLVGSGKGRYGLADMNAFPWVRAHRWAGVENMDDYPHVQAWLNRISVRPQAKAGLGVPDPTRATMTKEQEEELVASVRQWMFGTK
ncbi:glutathione S-transferase, carboxy-terminal domain protein [Rhizoctonia solani 123E]|uniref:Glutathione S-transferase, carboxy-terminal domain protein n=1 Tax=Rhizoctonia solani 123E TaxID=1423351 RepID=A0A074RX35_9AGAM|nr:glutathione S-transferase, carboxy-terminal domain protein [Rhizoctonia solani 123E]